MSFLKKHGIILGVMFLLTAIVIVVVFKTTCSYLFGIETEYTKEQGFLDQYNDGLLYKAFNVSREIDRDFIKSMDVTKTYYYKILYTYDEYLKYKGIMPEIRDLTEADFKRYYSIIILTDQNTNYGIRLLQKNNLQFDITQPENAYLNQKQNIVGMFVSINKDDGRIAKIEDNKIIISFK